MHSAPKLRRRSTPARRERRSRRDADGSAVPAPSLHLPIAEERRRAAARARHRRRAGQSPEQRQRDQQRPAGRSRSRRGRRHAGESSATTGRGRRLRVHRRRLAHDVTNCETSGRRKPLVSARLSRSRAMVDVILPVLDEAEAIPGVLAAMPAGFRPIVVDNGSTDGSGAIAPSTGRPWSSEPRRGFGAACAAGLDAAPSRRRLLHGLRRLARPGDLLAVARRCDAGAAEARARRATR